MDMDWGARSLVIAAGMAFYGYRKKSLDVSGAVAAVLVGFVTFFSHAKFGLTLIIFFLTSSRLTKIGKEIKRQREADFKEGGQRDWHQVLANSATALTAAALHFYLYRHTIVAWDAGQPVGSIFLQGAVLGHYACCAGDTWASELGILVSALPRSITRCVAVKPGTNGGVTLWGTTASVLGGLCMGLVFWLYDAWAVGALPSVSILVFGALGGLGGSLIDSVRAWACSRASFARCLTALERPQILGAECQYSGYCSVQKRVVNAPSKTTTVVPGTAGRHLLSNSQVNFVSSTLTALLCGYAAVTLLQTGVTV